MENSTLEKLQHASDLMKEAESLVREASSENNSLRGYYGYCLEIIAQELNKFSDNSMYYLTRNTSLQEIIESESENWFEDESTSEDEEKDTNE